MTEWSVCGIETIEQHNEKKDIESSICYECKTETKKFSWGMDLKKRVNKRQSSERQSSQRQSSARANSEQQVVSEKIIRPREDVWNFRYGEPNSFCNNKESERRLFIKRSVNEDNTVELVLNRSLSGKLMQIGFLESPEKRIESIHTPFEDSTFKGKTFKEKSFDLPLTIYFFYDNGKYIIRINGTNNQVEPMQNESTHYYYPIIKFSEHFGSGDELRYSNIGNYKDFTQMVTQMDVTFGGKKKRKTNRNRRKTTRKNRKTKKKCKKRSKYKK